jgi:Metallo-beta-lactamase superfamily
MSLHAVEAEQAMGARIIPFLEKVTETFSYLVIDPPTQAAAIIDPVLDYDPAAGRIRTHSADAIAKMVQSEGLQVERILETHVHADHLSAAGYLKKKLGGALGIGSNVWEVQRILGNLFNEKPANPPGAGFDQLFEDGETFRVGTLDVKALYTPGHTPADMCYMLEDAVLRGRSIVPSSGFWNYRRKPGYSCATTMPLAGAPMRSRQPSPRSARTRLFLPSLQVNMRAGEMPPPESNVRRYFKIPIEASTL